MNTALTGIGKEEQHSKYIVSSRKIVALGSDVHVKEFKLAVGEEVPWHGHTQMFDAGLSNSTGIGVVEVYDLGQ